MRLDLLTADIRDSERMSKDRLSTAASRGRKQSNPTTSLTNPATFDAFGRRIKKLQYENTYRMEPKATFPVDRATAIIKVRSGCYSFEL